MSDCHNNDAFVTLVPFSPLSAMGSSRNSGSPPQQTMETSDSQNVLIAHQKAPGSDSNTPHLEASLDEARQIFIEDLEGDIPCITFAFFRDYILPPVKAGVVEELVKTLKIQKKISGERWVEFPKDPANCAEVENSVFAPISAVYNNVIGEAKKKLKRDPLWKLQVDPQKNLTSESALHASFRVDAFGSLVKSRVPDETAKTSDTRDDSALGTIGGIDVAVPSAETGSTVDTATQDSKPPKGRKRKGNNKKKKNASESAPSVPAVHYIADAVTVSEFKKDESIDNRNDVSLLRLYDRIMH